jgi:hypothetical protein
MDDHSALRDLYSRKSSGHTTVQAELSRKWLTYFGVDCVEELDLGILEAIAYYVSRGTAPPNERV